MSEKKALEIVSEKKGHNWWIKTRKINLTIWQSVCVIWMWCLLFYLEKMCLWKFHVWKWNEWMVMVWGNDVIESNMHVHISFRIFQIVQSTKHYVVIDVGIITCKLYKRRRFICGFFGIDDRMGVMYFFPLILQCYCFVLCSVQAIVTVVMLHNARCLCVFVCGSRRKPFEIKLMI